jgi:hypothetical protein
MARFPQRMKVLSDFDGDLGLCSTGFDSLVESVIKTGGGGDRWLGRAKPDFFG